MTQPFSWTCSYCGQPTTITDPNIGDGREYLGTSNSEFGACQIEWMAIACPNPECKKLDLTVFLQTVPKKLNSTPELLKHFQLLPASHAKPQPNYIPQAIRQSYEQACAIVTLSPPASATLSRRCLQGIVRDYWEIPENKRGKLGAELNQIHEKVDADTWAAIQAVRSIGDIGAHMELDVNTIIDVEPDEAKLLIGLVETLLQDWYVERHKRRERNKALKELADSKLQQKRGAKAQASEAKSKQ